MIYVKSFFFTSVVFLSVQLMAQKPAQMDAAKIYQQLKKLNTVGSVLYLAAHPDDENQRVITYMANEVNLRSAYLSLTRGDGGQNLIGPEITEELGIIRTQELLEARKIDGGDQFFTRAIDFGYSKTPKETLEFWDRDKVLADVVWIYRKFRPDMVITRFPPDGRGGHGHHTSSALLAIEAFELSGTQNAYPEQLKYVEPWKPKKLYWNTSTWWYRDGGFNEDEYHNIDIGIYNPLLGKSYSEIAAESRSQHKSQGFGATGQRGAQKEFFSLLKGIENDSIFDGLDFSWNRIKGGEAIGKSLKEVLENYDFRKPERSVPALLKVRKLIERISDQHWKELKLKELDRILLAMTGTYLEATSESQFAIPGSALNINLEAINRSDTDFQLNRIVVEKAGFEKVVSKELPNNVLFNESFDIVLPQAMEYSQPYWLKNTPGFGIFNIPDQQLIGKPEIGAPLRVRFQVSVNGVEIGYDIPVNYKFNDPVDGETYRTLAIVPPVVLNLGEKKIFSIDESQKTFQVKIKSFNEQVTGSLGYEVPNGWTVATSQGGFQLDPNQEESIEISLTPTKKPLPGDLKLFATINNQRYDRSLNIIDYDHIKTQYYFKTASVQLVPIDLKKEGDLVGYIEGAGDNIPESLRQIGYTVNQLSENEVITEDLSKYEAIIIGIRAFNTRERLPFFKDHLFDYARNGGTLIVQYNTSFRLIDEQVAPFELNLSRKRITDEKAPLKMLDETHPVFNTPNKITSKDFDGWVQERGLYFPESWGDEFIPLLEGHDPDEEPTKGALLVAKYGKGHYVYTGLSFFRELPAGVPGAYRLFANLIALGNGDVN